MKKNPITKTNDTTSRHNILEVVTDITINKGEIKRCYPEIPSHFLSYGSFPGLHLSKGLFVVV